MCNDKYNYVSEILLYYRIELLVAEKSNDILS